MQLHDAQGKRLYLTTDERLAFMAAAARAARPVRTLCAVLHTTGCRISEALALTAEHVDLPLQNPMAIAVDAQGHIFVADQNTSTILLVDPVDARETTAK